MILPAGTNLSASEIAELDAALLEFARSVAQHKLAGYAPYRWAQSFHAAGATNPERMLMAANRVGKTHTAGAELALHLLGDYDNLPREMAYPETFPDGRAHPLAGQLVWPHGWKGKRFDHPIAAWTGSPTNETSRDIVQSELLGPDLAEGLGTGWIPRARLAGKPSKRQSNVGEVVDTFKVRHVSGGVSRCTLKAYEQGWKKWQGTAPHVVWMDEEPDDYKIFSEAQTRILTSSGIVMVTFTPLSGSTELVEHFQVGGPGIFLLGATWDDAPHLPKDERDRLAKSYRQHEREARTKGIPMLGEGAIFPVSDERIMVDPFRIPEHFARIKGCDFGYEHEAAGAEIAWDRDQDIVYVIDCYKEKGQLPPYHAAWFNKANSRVPVAWPHDGLNTEKSGGANVKDAYEKYGVAMMRKSARYPRVRGEPEKGGPQPQWPVIDEIRDRMMTGRFKVFRNLGPWFDEKRSYHVKATQAGEVKIVARKDDILKATFYAVMMKRYATPLTAINGNSGISAAPSRPIASSRYI